MFRPTLSRWLPKLRIVVLVAAAAVVLFGIVGYFAIPQLARWGLETVATRELGRTVRVESISANPYRLSVTLRGLVVEGATGESTPLLTVKEMTVNASTASLLYRAPVLDALTIDTLTSHIARLDAQRFNFSDILERLQAKPRTSDEPARFSLNNIRVSASTIHFDDRPLGSRHTISELGLGIPFLSNLPTHIEIDVQPALSARLDGTPFELRGETRPFDESLESSVNLRLDGLELSKYLAYSPVRLDFTVPSGTLSTDLRIAFRRAAPARGDRPAVQAQTIVAGRIEVKDFTLAAPAAAPKPLIAWKSLAVQIDEVEPFERRAVVGDIALVAPRIEAIRDAAGSINWVRFLQHPVHAPAHRAAEAASAPAAAAILLKQLSVRDGSVNYSDDSAGRFQLQLVKLQVDASQLTTTAAARGKVAAKFEIADGGGTASVDGEVGLAPIGGRLAVAMQGVRLRAPARYLAHIVNGTLDGNSDVSAVLAFEAGDPAMMIQLRDIMVRGKDLSLRGPQGSGADFHLAGLQLDNGTIDLTSRTITLGKLVLDGPRALVRRLQDGTLNWQQVLRARPAGATAPDAAGTGPAWTVLLNEAEIARGDVRFEDLAVEPAVRLRAGAITGSIRNVASDGSKKADIALRTRWGSGGTLAIEGGARWNPVAADVRVDARSLDVSAVRPYLAARLNAVLARAEISGRGRATVAQQLPDTPMMFNYRGGVRLANLHLLDARGESDLLKWQVLDLADIDAAAGQEPVRVAVGKVALSDFFARVIVSDQGRLNLADLVRRGDALPEAKPADTKGPATPARTPEAAPSMPVDRELASNVMTGPAPKATATVAAATADPATRPIIRIGAMEFTRGNVNFTDNFIKPNYTANLTGLGGSVSTLASDSAEPATLSLAGKIDDEAPVDINGRLNPLAPTLFLDIEGRTRGVDLPRLTPYAVKYAGYPIVKGKLSMEVSYKVEGGKLAANNHLFLDQLTFGEKVESPTATKLPVLLAVSLLKNSKGEIDINLPISGTLDDPKFSVGGIIVQVIINLLTKVVTAPFSLLAAAFGGGEELGYIEFAPGSAALREDQAKKINTLAKALTDRPGLKVDIIGRVDPAVDVEGARRAKYEAKLKAAKIRGLVRRGSDAVDPATVTVAAEERPALIAAVYADENIPDKPRNFIGIAKTIPAPEMEALILANLSATPEDLRALANQRATTVRNQLESQGKIPRERLFLVEPRLTAEGIQDKGAKARVDFSLK